MMTEPVAHIADSVARASLENYLEFLRRFRGTVTRAADAMLVDSEREDYRLFVPLTQDAIPRMPMGWTLLTLPWVPAPADVPSAVPLHKRTDFVVMSRQADGDALVEPAVRVCRSVDDIEAFSTVQTRGFMDEDELAVDEWYGWLHDMNRRNVADPACQFLVLDVDGRPAAVTLVLDAGGACGIYAVATLPDMRRRGLAARLLRASQAIARHRGHQRVCLQVYADSYAHGLYERLGFTEDYRLGIWARTYDCAASATADSASTSSSA